MGSSIKELVNVSHVAPNVLLRPGYSSKSEMSVFSQIKFQSICKEVSRLTVTLATQPVTMCTMVVNKSKRQRSKQLKQELKTKQSTVVSLLGRRTDTNFRYLVKLSYSYKETFSIWVCFSYKTLNAAQGFLTNMCLTPSASALQSTSTTPFYTHHLEVSK